MNESLPKENTVEEKDAYGLDGVEHDFVQKYQPKFLAKGGEHIVYETSGHPDIVVKVAVEPLKKIINWNAEHDLPIGSLPKEIEPRVQEYIKQEAERYQQMKTYFGAGHVLNQKKFLVKIPITDNILNNLYEGHPPIKGDETWGVVMVQKRAEELDDPKRLTLVAGYAEQGQVKEEDWNAATDHFVFGKNIEAQPSRDYLLTVQSNEKLKVLLERAEADEQLRESLKELVEKSISYTQETGEILDLIGEDNVVLSKKDGEWTYRLVDALYPHNARMVEKTKAVMLKLSIGKAIDEGEQNILMNAFNYVRTINGLAEKLGVEKRLNIIPEGMGNETVDYLAVIRKNLTFYQS